MLGDEAYTAALTALAGMMGMESLEFDADGACQLVILGHAPVELRKEAVGMGLTTLVVPYVPDLLSRTLTRRLLRMNFEALCGGMPSVGLDTTSEAMLLHLTLPLEDEEPAAILASFRSFLELRAELALTVAADDDADMPGGTLASSDEDGKS